jgi:hypothetical protein
MCAAPVLCAEQHKGGDGELTEEEEEEELEREEAAIEVVGEMQLTAEQLKARACCKDSLQTHALKCLAFLAVLGVFLFEMQVGCRFHQVLY